LRLTPLIAVVVLVAGCRNPRKPAFPVERKEAGSDKLNNAVSSAWWKSPCDKIVPNEWGHSWPVPLAGAKAQYSIFYYPAPGGFDVPVEVYPPAAKAVIDEDLGIPVSCERLPGDGPMLGKGLYPEATMKIKPGEFRRMLFRLFDRTERVGALYRKGAAPDAALLNEYFELFEKLSEPQFKAEYYRQNPAFWEWLRSAIGKSLPKP
jgi:hypothetical protein